MANTTYRVTLKKTATVNTDGTVRLRLWVSETSDAMPAAIFLYRQLPDIPGLERTDQYVGVCSLSDFVNYRTTVDSFRSHFRKSSIDILFKNRYELETWLTNLTECVEKMMNDITLTNEDTEYVDQTIDLPSPYTGYFRVYEQSSPDAWSCAFRLNLSHPLLVVERTASLDIVSPVEPVEIVSVATLADLDSLSDTAIYPGQYLSSSAYCVFNDRDKLETAKNALLEDIQLIVALLNGDYDYTVDQVFEKTAANDTVFVRSE